MLNLIVFSLELFNCLEIIYTRKKDDIKTFLVFLYTLPLSQERQFKPDNLLGVGISETDTSYPNENGSFLPEFHSVTYLIFQALRKIHNRNVRQKATICNPNVLPFSDNVTFGVNNFHMWVNRADIRVDDME